MLRAILTLLIVYVAIGVQSSSYIPNEFLSQIMSKLSGEPTASRNIPYKSVTVNQYVDYTDVGLGIFSQNLLVYDEFYKPGGPLFFLISARDDFFAYWLENSLVTDIVKQKGGAIYALEPRYHGDTRPTLDTSTSNLKNYFTLRLILADYIAVINSYKVDFEKLHGPVKIILFGYDTGATLATWLYSVYPHIVDGVWASSAPMYPAVEFSSYFSNVEAIIQSLSPVCHDRLSTAFTGIQNLIMANKGSQISEYFNIGNVLDTVNVDDINLFYHALLTGIGSIVEYGNIAVVAEFCTKFENVTPENSLDALAKYFTEFFNGKSLTYSNLLDHLKSDTWSSAAVINGERQQLFQSCSYLSWFRTSTPSSSIFNVNLPLAFYTKLCADVFEIKPEDITAGNLLTADTYKLPAGLTNIHFTNGAIDPYRQISVTSGIETQGTFDLIAQVGKAYDFPQTDAVLDLPIVIGAKLKVKNLLESWIS